MKTKILLEGLAKRNYQRREKYTAIYNPTDKYIKILKSDLPPHIPKRNSRIKRID